MLIKSFCPRLKKQLGFTMIELLIVIAILGILAVAVLSAINPIEQINRGRDTGSRSDAEQLLSAIERFYAMTGYYPWNTAVGDAQDMDWTVVNSNWSIDIGGSECSILHRLSEVVDPGACGGETGTQELKLGFVEKMDDSRRNDLYVYKDAETYTSAYVCFGPRSNAFQQEAMERISSGNLPEDYPPQGYSWENPSSGNDFNCGPQGICICLP